MPDRPRTHRSRTQGERKHISLERQRRDEELKGKANAQANERAKKRKYRTGDDRWRRIRLQVVREQPLCPECKKLGYIVSATQVDHKDNDPTNNDRDNLQGLCHSHHSKKTARERNNSVG